MDPVICMITGGAPHRRADGFLTERVRAAARAGVDFVQVRERDLEGGLLLELVSRCVEAVRGTRARVIVNDRLDVALAGRAHGVHLRGDSMPAGRIRAMVPGGFVIGRSVHDVEEAVTVSAEGGLDYLIFGTVFRSPTKTGRDPAGAAALASVVAATALPVMAVGGVTLEQVAGVAGAGAAGFAAITLFADATFESLPGLVRDARRSFVDGRSPR